MSHQILGLETIFLIFIRNKTFRVSTKIFRVGNRKQDTFFFAPPLEDEHFKREH